LKRELNSSNRKSTFSPFSKINSTKIIDPPYQSNLPNLTPSSNKNRDSFKFPSGGINIQKEGTSASYLLYANDLLPINPVIHEENEVSNAIKAVTKQDKLN
jgi:hypothetical protein